jgi:lipopolysaccharide transport system permease protein
MIPVLVAIMVIATLGITSALAAVNVRFRDVRYALPFAVQLWLFATPIAYPASLIHEPWRTVLAINPMAGVVEGFRWAVLGSGGSPWASIGVSAASSLVLLAGGIAYFTKAERGFADIV